MTKEEAIKRFETLLLHIDTDCVMGTETTEAINMAIKALEDPERKTGKWTKENACEFCGFQPWFERDIHTLSFCPNCGADMREGHDAVN